MSPRLSADSYRESAENGLAAARDMASAGAVGSELAETVAAAQTCALLYVGATMAELVEELRAKPVEQRPSSTGEVDAVAWGKLRGTEIY